MTRHRTTQGKRGLAVLAGALFAGASLAAAGERGAAADVGDGGARSDARAADPKAKIPPDPPALSEREQWVFVLRWAQNEPYLVKIQKTDMGGPHPTPRVMGRFALELFEGPTLIERVRFNFPMLGGAEPPDAGWKTPPRFEPGLKTRIGVLFPATKRGTRLELWDRATDRRWPLPWPPKEGVFSDPPASAPADAG
jgi:hypothetical protein